jgi:hypothetical protein
MIPEEIFGTLKAIFLAFSESIKLFRSRKCRETIKSFLEQFEELTKRIGSISQQEMQEFLNLLNSIMQTINGVLASNLCH